MKSAFIGDLREGKLGVLQKGKGVFHAVLVEQRFEITAQNLVEGPGEILIVVAGLMGSIRQRNIGPEVF